MRTGSGLLVAAALFGSCGKRPPPPPTGPVLQFRLDYAAARREGLAAEGTADGALQQEVVRILSRRMKALAGPSTRVEPKGTDGVWIRLEGGADRKEATDAATRIGGLEFRILVDPESTAPDMAAPLWPGSVDEFRAWKEAAVAARTTPGSDPVAPRPAPGGTYRLVRRLGAAGTTAADFAVVIEPDAASERFGREILERAQPSTDERGMPAVSWEVRVGRQAAFAEWTGRNVKQAVAILLDGELDQAPVLQAPLRESVQITLGGGGGDAASQRRLRHQQRTLVAALVMEPLPVRPVRVVPAAEEVAPPK